MNKVVVLPRKVAEAIDQIKSTNGIEVLYDLRSLEEDAERGNYLTKDILHYIEFDGGLKNYFAALVNGFKVEQTPEEKLLDYYVSLLESENRLEKVGQSGSQFRQGWQSVEETLKILDITVKGIND